MEVRKRCLSRIVCFGMAHICMQTEREFWFVPWAVSCFSRGRRRNPVSVLSKHWNNLPLSSALVNLRCVKGVLQWLYCPRPLSSKWSKTVVLISNAHSSKIPLSYIFHLFSVPPSPSLSLSLSLSLSFCLSVCLSIFFSYSLSFFLTPPARSLSLSLSLSLPTRSPSPSLSFSSFHCLSFLSASPPSFSLSLSLFLCLSLPLSLSLSPRGSPFSSSRSVSTCFARVYALSPLFLSTRFQVFVHTIRCVVSLTLLIM